MKALKRLSKNILIRTPKKVLKIDTSKKKPETVKPWERVA